MTVACTGRRGETQDTQERVGHLGAATRTTTPRFDTQDLPDAMREWPDRVAQPCRRVYDATAKSRMLHSPRGNGNTGWKAIFPDIRPREVDSIGTNARRAFTVGTFPYRSASQCTRLLDATLMKADSEDTLSERTSYEVLKDNAGCL